MSKDKIKIGDWVHLTGSGWAEEYPDSPEYVQVTEISEGIIRAGEVQDIGEAYELYGPDHETVPEYACEWVPASEVPAEIRFPVDPSNGNVAIGDNALKPGSESYTSIPSVYQAPPQPPTNLSPNGGIGNAVNPAHYGYPGGIQVIDLTRHMDFLLGNVVKYVARAGRKGNRLDDLKKAETYLRWAIEDEENK